MPPEAAEQAASAGRARLASRPGRSDAIAQRRSNTAAAGQPAPAARPPAPSPDHAFACGEGACVARHASGAVIVHVADEAAALGWCGRATLLVVEDATAREPCAGSGTSVLTGRDLARRGSAAVRLRAGPSGPEAEIVQAIREPHRPWHAHRRYSRAARGLLPYQRRDAAVRPDQPGGAGRAVSSGGSARPAAPAP